MNNLKQIISLKGFTVLELLVVIAIIGLLAAIVLTNVNEARDRGKAAHTIRQLEEIETAFKVYAVSNNLKAWWYIDGSGPEPWQRKVSDFINNTPHTPPYDSPGFNEYLSASPKSINGKEYRYRNSNFPMDSDGCGQLWKGVVIHVNGFFEDEPNVYRIIEQMIDNGYTGATLPEEECGRVRHDTTGSQSLYWLMADDTNDI